MKVFITGIAGFIGSHLADTLLERGHSVEGNDHLRGGDRRNVPNGAVLHVLDCNEREALLHAAAGSDVIVHCAASAHEGLSVFSPATITRDNMYASANVFSVAAALGVRRVVFCSSMARYGRGTPPFTEDMTPQPCDPYGINKLASELLLTNLAGAHGFEHAIVVPHNVVGARQRYDDPFRNVAAIMINLMLQGRQPFIYGDGSQTRCFSPVRDVARTIADVVCDEGDVSGLVMNVGTDRGATTVLQLAEDIAERLGLAFDPRFVGGRPLEVHHATCSTSLARARYGFEERYTLDDALDALIDTIRERGPRPFDYELGLEIEGAPVTWVERLF